MEGDAISEMMDLFKEGSPKAFEAIWKEFYSRLVSFSEQLVNDREIAKEIASDSIMKCLMKKRDFESFLQIKAFLYIATRNSSIDSIRFMNRKNRAQKRYFSNLKEEDSIDEQVDAEMMDNLSRSIEKLPSRSKEVIKLLYLKKLSYQQIADKMKISISTVANIRAYALEKMRCDFPSKVIELAIMIFLLSFNIF